MKISVDIHFIFIRSLFRSYYQWTLTLLFFLLSIIPAEWVILGLKFLCLFPLGLILVTLFEHKCNLPTTYQTVKDSFFSFLPFESVGASIICFKNSGSISIRCSLFSSHCFPLFFLASFIKDWHASLLKVPKIPHMYDLSGKGPSLLSEKYSANSGSSLTWFQIAFVPSSLYLGTGIWLTSVFFSVYKHDAVSLIIYFAYFLFFGKDLLHKWDRSPFVWWEI